MITKLDLEPTKILNTEYKKNKAFIIIGAGGTGSYFIPNLARQVSEQNRLRRIARLPIHTMMIIDGDEIGTSNLNRQNFIEKDLEMKKAHVLSHRYGSAFSLDIPYMDEYITSKEMLMKIVLKASEAHKDTIPVIVDCVDNNKTRAFIQQVFVEYNGNNGIYSLSSGNELYTGQVVCGFNPKTVSPKKSIFRTPSVADMFPEVMNGEDKLPTEMSCDEAAVSHPQSIMTNIFAANLLFNFANLLLTSNFENPDNPGLSYFAITYDTQNGTTRRFGNKKSVITSAYAVSS